MEKQKMRDIKKWLSQIPQDQAHTCTSTRTDSLRDLKSRDDCTRTEPAKVPSQSEIDDYKYYSVSSLCFGVVLSLNGAVLAPLGFASPVFCQYYPFKIFGLIFIVLGVFSLTIFMFFLCKRRLMIQKRRRYWQDSSSFGRSGSSETVRERQERNRYKWGFVYTLTFGVLLIMNGSIVTPLGAAVKHTNSQIEGFGPVLIIIGLIFIAVSAYLFRGLRNISVTKLNNTEKLRTNLSAIQTTYIKGGLLGNVDNDTKSDSDGKSSCIWMKIDSNKCVLSYQTNTLGDSEL